MPRMGRHRRDNLGLPPRMRVKHGGYYYDSYAAGKPRKWIFLSRDLNKARIEWAKLEDTGDTSTFGALHDKYMAECISALAAGTQSNYTYAGAVLRKEFGKVPLLDITPQTIAEYLDGHPSKTSANNQVMLMGVMFEKAMRWGWCQSNPCRGVRRNKVKKRDVYATDADFIAVRSFASPHLSAVMDIAYVTSLRISDILKIRHADIKADGLHTTHKKTGKRQIFALTNALSTALASARAIPHKVGSLFLLSRHDGQPYDPNTLQIAMRAACKRAGVAPFHIHDIRAKAATDAANNGEDYFKLLGHSDRSMSDRYVKARQIDVVKSGRKVL